jgi:hypothetical protein
MIPLALEHVHEIARSDDRLAVFLDYDGTLTPIVRNGLKAGSLQHRADGAGLPSARKRWNKLVMPGLWLHPSSKTFLVSLCCLLR